MDHAVDFEAKESDITLMLRLMLLRHGKTERTAPGERDRDRKLTKRGRADVPTIGAYMAQHHLIPDLALVSPAARSEETWKLLSAAFARKPKVVAAERVYNASAEDLMAVIGEAREAQAVLVVGHNPGLHDLALELIASGDAEARERLNEKLPTSGLVLIDFPFDDWSHLHPQSGRLERFVSPHLIASATE